MDSSDRSSSNVIANVTQDWPKERNKQRMTFKAGMIDPKTKKTISMASFTNVEKDIDEVRYILGDKNTK